jgi:hypothetical protein
VYVDAWDEVDYGGGANSERQNLNWFQDVYGSRHAIFHIGMTEENPSSVGHAHVARPNRLQQPMIRERPNRLAMRHSLKTPFFPKQQKDKLGSSSIHLTRARRASCPIESS